MLVSAATSWFVLRASKDFYGIEGHRIGGGSLVVETSETQSMPWPLSVGAPAAAGLPDFVLAASRSTPAVVFIESTTESDETVFFMPRTGVSTGSGVLISPDGHIATNNHVVEKSKRLRVVLNDNREFEAKWIGSDPTTDLALLKIEGDQLPYLRFGNSDSAQVGEWVLAVGNPLRLQSTVTAGIISAKARNINILNHQKYRIESFIQTDAAVNPGNSGGALVNRSGELIGINTAILSQTGRYEGYSFSIPSNLVKKVIFDIRDYGTVQRGLLGVVIEELDDQRAKAYGLTKVEGVLITSTTPGGAAAEAGLKAEDIILNVDGRAIKSVPELQEIIGRMRPGVKVRLGYWRNNKRMDTDAVLKNHVNSVSAIMTSQDPLFLELGMEVRDLTPEESLQLKRKGVKVTSIYSNSIIEATNMAPDYIITSANGKRIRTTEELLKELQDSGNEVVLNGFYENYEGNYPYRFYLSR
ncbi:MAG: trypsin-like peptidase domain-containing protein [Saprospiraceae bacterium]|nr:trypsin-like peptidase domain-containing protein [Saprospiraceae bacterium]MBP9208864.1 trypsin-like peptidase domain-containing protein [Saprospiraceae bacterium]